LEQIIRLQELLHWEARSYRKDLGTTETSTNPIYNNPLWTSDVQKNPNTVNRYIAGIELTHSFTDKFKILTRANVDGYTDEKYQCFRYILPQMVEEVLLPKRE
jgi:hypothetical protein